MAQIDNFRKVLGLPNPEELSSPESAVKVGAQVIEPHEQPGQQEQLAEQSAMKEKNKTLLVKKSTHDRLSAILFWMRRYGEDEHPTMDKLVREMLEEYLAGNPEAKRFVEKNA